MTIQDRTTDILWPDDTDVAFDGIATGGEMYDRIAKFTVTTGEPVDIDARHLINDLLVLARGTYAPAHHVTWAVSA